MQRAQEENQSEVGQARRETTRHRELGGQRNPGVTGQVELPHTRNSPRSGMEKPPGSLCMTLKLVLALSRPHLLPCRMRAWTLRSCT